MPNYYGSILPLSSDSALQTDAPLAVDGCGLFVLPKDDRAQIFRPSGRKEYLLIYIKSGQGYYHIGEKLQVIGSNHCILYFPGEPQYYHYRGVDDPQIYWVHFTGSQVLPLLEELGMAENRVFSVKGGSYSVLLDQIIQELQLKQPHYTRIINCKFYELLLLLSRDRIAPSSHTSEIKDALNLFHTQYYRPISIKEYARSCNISPCWFTRQFREQLGMSPQQYLTKLRISHACNQLGFEFTITEVAQQVGYEDPLYFSRVFKQHTGLSPSAYRKKHFDHLQKLQQEDGSSAMADTVQTPL